MGKQWILPVVSGFAGGALSLLVTWQVYRTDSRPVVAVQVMGPAEVARIKAQVDKYAEESRRKEAELAEELWEMYGVVSPKE